MRRKKITSTVGSVGGCGPNPTCRGELAVNSPRSHCIVCHETFDTPNSFDDHRGVASDEDGFCYEASSLGLIMNRGVWSTPESAARLNSRVEALERARQQN